MAPSTSDANPIFSFCPDDISKIILSNILHPNLDSLGRPLISSAGISFLTPKAAPTVLPLIRAKIEAAAERPHCTNGFLTLEQAAEHLGVSANTVRRMIKQEKLQAHQVAPCAPWQILVDSLDSDSVRQEVEHIKNGLRCPSELHPLGSKNYYSQQISEVSSMYQVRADRKRSRCWPRG